MARLILLAVFIGLLIKAGLLAYSLVSTETNRYHQAVSQALNNALEDQAGKPVDQR